MARSTRNKGRGLARMSPNDWRDTEVNWSVGKQKAAMAGWGVIIIFLFLTYPVAARISLMTGEGMFVGYMYMFGHMLLGFVVGMIPACVMEFIYRKGHATLMWIMFISSFLTIGSTYWPI